MAAKRPRPSPRTVTPAAFAKLERTLELCGEKIARLEREVEINIRRMAAIQAEIDYLRASRKQ